jgi:hypothetical protein
MSSWELPYGESLLQMPIYSAKSYDDGVEDQPPSYKGELSYDDSYQTETDFQYRVEGTDNINEYPSSGYSYDSYNDSYNNNIDTWPGTLEGSHVEEVAANEISDYGHDNSVVDDNENNLQTLIEKSDDNLKVADEDMNRKQDDENDDLEDNKVNSDEIEKIGAVIAQKIADSEKIADDSNLRIDEDELADAAEVDVSDERNIIVNKIAEDRNKKVEKIEKNEDELDKQIIVTADDTKESFGNLVDLNRDEVDDNLKKANSEAVVDRGNDDDLVDYQFKKSAYQDDNVNETASPSAYDFVQAIADESKPLTDSAETSEYNRSPHMDSNFDPESLNDIGTKIPSDPLKANIGPSAVEGDHIMASDKDLSNELLQQAFSFDENDIDSSNRLARSFESTNRQDESYLPYDPNGPMSYAHDENADERNNYDVVKISSDYQDPAMDGLADQGSDHKSSWVMLSSESGDNYYYNLTTGQSSWDPPSFNELTDGNGNVDGDDQVYDEEILERNFENEGTNDESDITNEESFDGGRQPVEDARYDEEDVDYGEYNDNRSKDRDAYETNELSKHSYIDSNDDIVNTGDDSEEHDLPQEPQDVVSKEENNSKGYETGYVEDDNDYDFDF